MTRSSTKSDSRSATDNADIRALQRRKLQLEIERKQLELERLRNEYMSRAKLREVYDRIKKDLDSALNLLTAHKEKNPAIGHAMIKIEDALKRMRLWL